MRKELRNERALFRFTLWETEHEGRAIFALLADLAPLALAAAARGLPPSRHDTSMPVVMTGSPGNGLGGAAGASFGSGLSGLTRSPPKLFTPELEVWQKRATEDASLSKERKKTYDE